MIDRTFIEDIRVALSNADAAKDTARKERERVAELRLQQRQDDGERERLRAAEEHDAAIRLLDGEAAAPRKTRRVNRLAKLDAEAPALTAAITQQQQRADEAERATSAPLLPLVAATLDIVAEIQGSGLTEAREILASLAPVAARLIAADQVRLGLIGERFPMPPGKVPPFRSLMLIKALSQALPERLRPPELAETRLLDAAREISTDILAQIKEIKA